MIYVETIAYNATKTLVRTIESVLNQTYGDFVYYLCDNGSTDDGGTRRIVEEYAKKDSRIVPFYNEKNHVWDKNKSAITLPHDIAPDDFYCHLDADDEYYLTFLEEMLKFITENDLDIAACGSDFINANDNGLLHCRVLTQDLIVQGNGFQEHFRACHQFMRTIWGKMFKGKTLVNTVVGVDSSKVSLTYGNDTIFTMCAFGDASRLGILAKPLHKYYVSTSSTSYVYYPERIESDIFLYNLALDYLKPYGKISPENKDFLNLVYLAAITDTIGVLFRSDLEVFEKLKELHRILTHEVSRQVFSEALPHPILINLKQSCIGMFTDILARIDRSDLNELIYDCLCAFNAALKPFITPDSLKTLTDEGFIEVALKLNDEKLIAAAALKLDNAPNAFGLILPTVRENILLKGISLEFLKAYRPVVLDVYLAAFSAAQEKIIAIIEADDYAAHLTELAELGINIAALQKDMGLFMGLKIVKARLLLRDKNFDEAKNVLDDLNEMLPDDPEIQELTREYENGRNILKG